MSQYVERHPIVTTPKGLKINANQSQQTLTSIKLHAEINKNRPALYFTKEKRDMVPRLVEICEFYNHFIVVRYKCYDPSGKFRQYLYTSIMYVDIMIGECRLKFFDKDI